MKLLIVLSAFVGVASATYLPAIAPLASVAASTGTSSQFRTEDDFGNYNFGYDEAHATGATSRREEQINGVRRGMYSLSDADGRRRIVNYVADAAGFRAAIDTNEPGVEPKDPANVSINKAASVVAVAAPAPVPVSTWTTTQVAAVPVVTAPVAIEAPAPRAFSYSFGSTHHSVGPLATARIAY